MPANIALFRDEAVTDRFSTDKVPYQVGYNPIFKGETFNATDGKGRNAVCFLHEIFSGQDFYYTEVELTPHEVGPYQRDPDRDGHNEWHVYLSAPVETPITNETIGTGDGVTEVFEAANRWIKPGTEEVRVGAAVKERNVHYAINHRLGTVRLFDAPLAGTPVYMDYTHGDDGSGGVNVPSDGDIEANGDWTWTPVWDVPHGVDALRGAGMEADCVPVIVRGVVDALTTDPHGNAITLWEQQLRNRAWEHSAKY